MKSMNVQNALPLAYTLAAIISFAGVAGAQTAVPKDFKVELLAQPPAVEHPSVVTCDDQGGLFVGEDPMDMRGPTTKEFDRVLYITFNPDGSIKRKTVFCDNLSAVFGLVWRDDALYVMHAPHYTMFKDTDGDGVADVRKDLAQGFGPPAGVFGFNDHIVTGTRLGMDGFVYVSVGDKGIQKATSLGDKSTVTLEGGGVVRMRLDGTQLENFTSGTRNHLDVAMDSLDNIFTYDNTDDGLGWWTRFTYHMPTGYYGYPYDYHPHPERHLPRLSEHGGGSPVGGDGYRDAYWPARFRGAIFYCEWGKGKVQVFFPKKNGASFDVTMEDFFVKSKDAKEEFRPLDLCFSPDGKHMYVADWNYGGWTNPKVAGRLYRVTYVGTEAKDEPESPFGARRNGEAPPGDSAPTADLIKTLAHPAYARRMQAQWALAKRGAVVVKPLSDVLADKAQPTAARIHALWALHAMVEIDKDFNPVPQIVTALHNGPDELRAQAARALGTRRINASAVNAAVKGLIHRAKNDPDGYVRMQAAVALGRLGAKEAAAELFASLDDADRFAWFAKVQALRAINEWATAPAFLNASNERTREGTALALTGVYDDGAVAALDIALHSNPHPAIRALAAQALAEVHRKADPYVKGWWGTQPARGKPARAKKYEWSGTATVLKALADALKDEDASVRLAAIKAMQEIGDAGAAASLRGLTSTEKDDAVRAQVMRTLAAMKDAASAPLFGAMTADAKLPAAAREEAIRAIMAIGAKDAVAPVTDLVKDDKTPESLLILAMQSLASLNAAPAAPAVEARLGHADAKVRAAAVESFGTLAGRSAAAKISAALKDADAEVKRAALRTLARIDAREAIPAMIDAAIDVNVKRDAILALATMPDRRALSLYLDGLADKSAELRAAAGPAIASLRGVVIDDLLSLQKANELRPEVRRELASLFSTPRPVMQWQIIGAWSKDDAQPVFDLKAAPKLDQSVKIGQRTLKWQSIKTKDAAGMFTPGQYVNPNDNNWALAYTAIEAASPGTYAWSLGSDDQAILFINGKKVYEFNDNRGYSAGSAKGTVQLEAGMNHIYFQTGNSGGPWQFGLALGGRDEKLAFLYKDTPPQLDLTAYRNHAAKEKGDAARGRKIFFDASGVGCVKCHAIGKEGASTVGPNLLAVGAKYPREEIIRSILEPSNRIFSGYELSIIETTEGDILTGIIKTETDSEIELVDANAKSIKLAKKSIAERRKSNLSMMPNGLEKGLTLQDFADIVAYLEGEKK
jgi:putative membrane-bound dehydrogenase-like protein